MLSPSGPGSLNMNFKPLAIYLSTYHLSSTYACLYVCTYACMHVCTYVCMHVSNHHLSIYIIYLVVPVSGGTLAVWFPQFFRTPLTSGSFLQPDWALAPNLSYPVPGTVQGHLSAMLTSGPGEPFPCIVRSCPGISRSISLLVARPVKHWEVTFWSWFWFHIMLVFPPQSPEPLNVSISVSDFSCA